MTINGKSLSQAILEAVDAMKTDPRLASTVGGAALGGAAGALTGDGFSNSVGRGILGAGAGAVMGHSDMGRDAAKGLQDMDLDFKTAEFADRWLEGFVHGRKTAGPLSLPLPGGFNKKPRQLTPEQQQWSDEAKWGQQISNEKSGDPGFSDPLWEQNRAARTPEQTAAGQRWLEARRHARNIANEKSGDPGFSNIQWQQDQAARTPEQTATASNWAKLQGEVIPSSSLMGGVTPFVEKAQNVIAPAPTGKNPLKAAIDGAKPAPVGGPNLRSALAEPRGPEPIGGPNLGDAVPATGSPMMPLNPAWGPNIQTGAAPWALQAAPQAASIGQSMKPNPVPAGAPANLYDYPTMPKAPAPTVAQATRPNPVPEGGPANLYDYPTMPDSPKSPAQAMKPNPVAEGGPANLYDYPTMPNSPKPAVAANQTVADPNSFGKTNWQDPAPITPTPPKVTPTPTVALNAKPMAPAKPAGPVPVDDVLKRKFHTATGTDYQDDSDMDQKNMELLQAGKQTMDYKQYRQSRRNSQPKPQQQMATTPASGSNLNTGANKDRVVMDNGAIGTPAKPGRDAQGNFPVKPIPGKNRITGKPLGEGPGYVQNVGGQELVTTGTGSLTPKTTTPAGIKPAQQPQAKPVAAMPKIPANAQPPKPAKT